MPGRSRDVDAATLDEALELGSLVLPEVPGKSRLLDLPGVIVRSTGIASPFANLAGRVRLDPSTVDDSIDALAAHFGERGLPYGVMVGPASTPTDLRARLTARGLSLHQRCKGLVLEDLGLPIPHCAEVVVERIGVERRAAFDAIKASSFGMPLSVAQGIDDLLFGDAIDSAVFHLATLDGAPVGFAQTFYYRGVAILGGAGVVPSARGRGVFRSLLAARFELAREEGNRAATIQAYDHTSAPILERLGFRQRCELELWAWAPEG